MGCGQSKKIHLYPRKNKSKSNGKKGHGKRENEDFIYVILIQFQKNIRIMLTTINIILRSRESSSLLRHSHYYCLLYTKKKSQWQQQYIQDAVFFISYLIFG